MQIYRKWLLLFGLALALTPTLKTTELQADSGYPQPHQTYGEHSYARDYYSDYGQFEDDTGSGYSPSPSKTTWPTQPPAPYPGPTYSQPVNKAPSPTTTAAPEQTPVATTTPSPGDSSGGSAGHTTQLPPYPVPEPEATMVPDTNAPSFPGATGNPTSSSTPVGSPTSASEGEQQHSGSPETPYATGYPSPTVTTSPSPQPSATATSEPSDEEPETNICEIYPDACAASEKPDCYPTHPGTVESTGSNLDATCDSDSECCDSGAACQNGVCCVPTAGSCETHDNCCSSSAICQQQYSDPYSALPTENVKRCCQSQSGTCQDDNDCCNHLTCEEDDRTGGRTCQPFGIVCGDGEIDQYLNNEDCDDGNLENGDGCDENCKLEPGFEMCLMPFSSKIAPCPICGDGLRVGGEIPHYYSCDALIPEGQECVDIGCCECLIIDGWSCENVPHPERPGYLTSECTHTCGNGLIDDPENCDDGNLEDGDGCSGGCRIEPGWNCSNSPDSTPHTSCEERCGDGLIVGEEECDDRNQLSSDGCSDTCQLEEGWSCIEISTGMHRSDPSIPHCTSVCGDTLIRGEEECDDGNRDNGDGCSENCEYEPSAMCCVCQYQDFDECRGRSAANCAYTETSDGQYRCRFHDGECKSEFKMNCDEWAATDVVQTACEFGPIVQEVGSSFPTSCPSLYYIYRGHGNCDIAQDLVRACVSCETDDGCRAISVNLLSCSSFPNLEAVYAMAEDVIRPNLQPGDVVQISAEQNTGFTDRGGRCQDFENKITLTLEYGDTDLDIDYANCDDPSEFEERCGPLGAVSVCKEFSPPAFVTNICCPNGVPVEALHSYGSWHRTEPQDPVCPGKCREESLCFASRPAHQSSCSQVGTQVENDITRCLYQKKSDCEEAGGVAIVPPYIWGGSLVELDSSTGQCQASYEAVCMKSC